MKKYDVIIIGAGAAGMMCAIETGKRNQKTLILEKTNRPGKKILMSGGGRCNFTNFNVSHENYISHNKHFCKSALSRYTAFDFIKMVEKHRITYHEKKRGQLFCNDKSSQIVEMLLSECQRASVEILLEQNVLQIEKTETGFQVRSNQMVYDCLSLVIATGGLSIPTLGSSPFAYHLAEQFDLKVYPLMPGLVPLTLHPHDKEQFSALSGIALDARVACGHQYFDENILFTHRGLSGPAILQISSFWKPGSDIQIKLLPEKSIDELITSAKKKYPNAHLKTFLHQFFPKKMLEQFFSESILNTPIKQLVPNNWQLIIDKLQNWRIKPAGTEGYRTAEVTLGGIDCDALSSQTFESKKVPGLYFIGESVDVTGWLGGYNFQWAWSSGWVAGQYAGVSYAM